MGRCWIDIDPDFAPGKPYKYLQEDGLYWFLEAGDLLKPDRKLWAGAPTLSTPLESPRIFNPENSDWLICQPLQWRPEWYKNADLANYVLDQSRWVYSAFASVTESELETRKPDGTSYPADKWQTVRKVEAGSGIYPVNFTNLAAAAGVTLPTGIEVIGVVHNTPGPIPTNGLSEAFYTPHLEFLVPPPPDECFVFGFSHFAILVYVDRVIILRSPGNDKVSWEKLHEGALWAPSPHATGGGLMSSPSTHLLPRRITVLPVGPDYLYFYVGTNGVQVPIQVRIREAGGLTVTADGITLPTNRPPADHWWLGLAPGQRLNFQAQVVGYEFGLSAVFTETPTLFDLGDGYKPDTAPKFRAAVLLNTEEEADTAFTDGTLPEAGNGGTAENTVTGELVQYRLIDESGDPWDSDSTHQKGGFFLIMRPRSVNGEGYDYLSPQIGAFEVRFPPLLTDRDNNLLRLDDTKWQEWEASVSLWDPLAKELVVRITEATMTELTDAGFLDRDWFAVHVIEDADDDDVPDTIRVRAWCANPTLRLVAAENSVHADPIQVWELRCKGLLSRADQPFLRLSQMINPETPGFVEHDFAVMESLRVSGFDVDDTDVFEAFPDPFAGQRIARLPGTWGLESGQVGSSIDSPWAPALTHSRLQYAQWVAREFRGWLVYEDLAGVIHYHPDLLLETSIGERYYSENTIYRSSPLAAAAGRTKQAYMPDAQRRMESPKASVVRVSGKGTDNADLPHVIDRDTAAITTIADRNYVGERKIEVLHSRLALDTATMQQIARVFLLQCRLRRFWWPMEVPKLPPWEIGPGTCEVGYCVTFQSREAEEACLIDHLHTRQITSRAGTGGFYQTRITGQRLPSGATAGTGAGSYPGQGVA